MVEHARLLEVISYDPETGIFRWRINKRKMLAGALAGTWTKGYLTITVDYKRYQAARVAWFYVYREWPPELVDHINQNPRDNRISNLRLANKWQNSANAKDRRATLSGARGVYYDKGKWKRKRWTAYINHNGRRTTLGFFMTKEEAIAARETAERIYHREFANSQT